MAVPSGPKGILRSVSVSFSSSPRHWKPKPEGCSHMGGLRVNVSSGARHEVVFQLRTWIDNHEVPSWASWRLSGKEPACQCRSLRRHRFNPWVGKIPWSRKWQPAPVFLPGKFHGQRMLAGYVPWSCKELDRTERLNTQHTQVPSWSLFHSILFQSKKKREKERMYTKAVYLGNSLCCQANRD